MKISCLRRVSHFHTAAENRLFTAAHTDTQEDGGREQTEASSSQEGLGFPAASKTKKEV